MVDRFLRLLLYVRKIIYMSGILDLFGEYFPGWVGVGNFESRPKVIFRVLTTFDGDNLDSIGSNRLSGPVSVLELKEHKASLDWDVFDWIGSEI